MTGVGTTTNTGLYLLAENQGGAEVTFNESMYKLDALSQLSAIDQINDPASIAPSTGDVYLVGIVMGTNEFTGKDHHIAYYVPGGQWRFIAPKEGMVCWRQDESSFYTFSGISWEADNKDSVSGHLALAIEQYYTIDLRAVEDYTITAFGGLCGSGDCDIALRVSSNGTGSDETSSNLDSIGTSLSEVTSLTISVSKNDRVELHVENVANAVDVQFYIQTKRTYS